MKVQMSEARYNDLVYMALKCTFFEPVMGANPREADIRICMQMGSEEMMAKATLQDSILSPTEVAPKSHDTQYQIDTDRVFEAVIDYLTDHWRATATKKQIRAMKKDFDTKILPSAMNTKEEECGQ